MSSEGIQGDGVSKRGSRRGQLPLIWFLKNQQINRGQSVAGEDIPGPGYRCGKAGGTSGAVAWACWGAGMAWMWEDWGELRLEHRLGQWRAWSFTLWVNTENHEGLWSMEATAGGKWHSTWGDKRKPVRSNHCLIEKFQKNSLGVLRRVRPSN